MQKAKNKGELKHYEHHEAHTQESQSGQMDLGSDHPGRQEIPMMVSDDELEHHGSWVGHWPCPNDGVLKHHRSQEGPGEDMLKHHGGWGGHSVMGEDMLECHGSKEGCGTLKHHGSEGHQVLSEGC